MKSGSKILHIAFCFSCFSLFYVFPHGFRTGNRKVPAIHISYFSSSELSDVFRTAKTGDSPKTISCYYFHIFYAFISDLAFSMHHGLCVTVHEIYGITVFQRNPHKL